ncbi:hypothetical protein TNCV_1590911 [Trichonephila clavipes]|nr:hypothetical protein TNCV_1590911 [Trichonephila clavipes]
MLVGDYMTIVRMGIGEMQRYLSDKMTGGLLIAVHSEIVPRGTMLIKGSRTRTIITNMIIGSRIEVIGISSEIGVRVTILTEDGRHGGRLNCLRVRVDQDDQSHMEVNPPI